MADPRTSAQLRLFLFGRFQLKSAVPKPGSANAASGRSLTGTVAAPRLPVARKAQSLLAYLVLHPQTHTREELAALLWGDVPDPHARGSLRRALTLLRRHLGPQLLLADRENVQLNPQYPIWADAVEFARVAESYPITELSPESDIRPLLSALDLCHGELLSDFYDDWVLPERERYRELYLDMLVQAGRWMRAHGEYTRAIAFAEKVLEQDTASERAHQIMMFCYLRLGRRRAALRQYDECRRALREELDVEPSPETTALYQKIKEAEAPLSAPNAALTNLPTPLTSFVGREALLSELKDTLGRTRLLTLTGTGGCGKTRLAIRLATEIADQFADGAWWVELAALNDPGLVPQTVARVLGVSETPRQPLLHTLAEYLRPKQVLLLIDNCEHLLEASALLAETLLQQCPRLQILATSRQALNVAGETLCIVPSLTIPDVQSSAPSPYELSVFMEQEGVRLFIERARAVKPDLALTPENNLAVARICQRLDGIPLAIELAAGRMKVLSAEQIAERLHDAFALLATNQRAGLPRHRTLQAAIDWSHELLSHEEQILFRRLSVFAGDFSLDAVESVCAGSGLPPGAILDLLSGLVDKSLLLVGEGEGSARYRLLELVRQYAHEKLGESRETVPIQNRHLDMYLQLAEKAETELRGRNQKIWFNRLDRELDNLRAAFEWSLGAEGESEKGLGLAAALLFFWRVRRFGREGRWRLERALASVGARQRTERRLKALNAVGYLAGFEGDHAAARAYGQEALALARELGNQRGTAFALSILAGNADDSTRGLTLWSQSLALWREVGDKWSAALALNALGELARSENDYENARSHYEESLAIRRELGDTLGTAVCLNNLGFVEHHLGNEKAARGFCREGWVLWRQVGGRAGGAECLIGLAGADELKGTPGSLERAARLLGAVEALLESIATPLVSQDRTEFDRIRERLTSVLDEKAFASAWAEGRAMTLEQAGEHALAA